MRNMWPRITGGSYSRAGTAFTGYSKQTGRAYPPRLIPFQFSILQGRILEFGNEYMRVIANGGYVLDVVLPITAATNTNPLTVTIPSSGGATASPINTGVYSSYAPGEIVTVAGGTGGQAAQVTVGTTTVLSLLSNPTMGQGYAPSNTITLAGGTPSTNAEVTISTTQVTSITVVAAGSGGTNGAATITGTTGTGTKFSASVIIASGAISAITSLTFAGSYTANPSNVNIEPVTGGGLASATVAITMGPLTVTLTNNGVYTANPAGGVFTQSSTSGSGTGAQFVSALMGVNSATVTNPGSYTVDPANPVQQAFSSGGGLGVAFTMTWNASSAAFSAGQWLEFSGVGGMTQLNGRTLVVAGNTGNVYSFNDVYGNPVDATTWGAFSAGGDASRIYTAVSPYSEEDLKWLKWTQSADVVSICCVNQDTLSEYPPYDLERFSDTNWIFQETSFIESVAAPGSCWAVSSNNFYAQWYQYPSTYTPTVSAYAYVVTAVNATDGTESVASPVANVANGVNLNVYPGTITIYWSPVTGVNQYNVYKAEPAPQYGWNSAAIPVGAIFGYCGTALGTQFSDGNIVPDFTQTPPLHQNPFAPGQILAVTLTSGGNQYYSTATATINSITGSGAILGTSYQFQQFSGWRGPIGGFIIENAGQGYLPTDTVTITGDGSGATASLTVGPATGTYPSVVAYFQQRRVYASSLNDPDTYWMSQVGDYANMDARIPVIASDAITGTPWTQQVNGIQAFIQMPGGLVTLTGLGAWQLGGDGSSSFNPQPITPSSQQAQPQAFNGCSPTVPPIKIDYDILYVQAKGSIYRDLTYQFFTNIYTGRDITVNSPHLFLDYTILEHAWSEEPYKLLWAVRSDGALLSLTFYRPEEVLGWSRHDTYGQFISIASVTEPPVDAVYVAVNRPIGPSGEWTYTIERMDNRLWQTAEDPWCVDCGLQYPMPEPDAALTISTAVGQGTIAGVTALVGGQNYGPATFAQIIDNNGLGTGSGAVVGLSVSGGVITGLTVTPGSGYTFPQLVIIDPSGQGSGASATLVLSTQATFTTSAPTFAMANIGYVIRALNGVATINSYVNSTTVTADYTFPCAAVMPLLGNVLPPVAAGDWTLTQPVQVVGNLEHLAGQTVTGLADGFVITPRTVSTDGSVQLDQPATAITIGLGFVAQLQSLYLDTGEPTVQGQRKKLGAVTARVDSSAGFLGGSNQPDGSAQTPMQLAPSWNNLTEFPNPNPSPYVGGAQPFYTGDIRVPVQSSIAKPGQVCFQQSLPQPFNLLSLIPEAMQGDTPEQKAQPKGRGQQQ